MNRQTLLDHLAALLITIGLAWSLTMMICESMQLSAASNFVLLLVSGCAVLLAIGHLSKKYAVLIAIVAAGVGVIIALSPVKPFQRLIDLGKTFVAFNAGEAASMADHSLTIATLLALMMALVMHWLARMQGGVYPALTLSVVVLLTSWLVDKRLSAAYVICAGTALAMMFARAPDERLPYFRALPAALLAAVLAYMLIPAGNPTWAPLREGAERVRKLFYDYFLFTETRVTYSLYPDGFQPMGEALGGPADPKDNTVMLVQADEPLLLRGAIKRTYTTYAWTNSTVNNRYLFVDPTKRAVRDSVFDSARAEDGAPGLSTTHVKITMLNEGISTLYVPHRLQSLDAGMDNAIYYNTAGEVFITRGVQRSDQYELTFQYQQPPSAALERLTASAAGLDDPQFQTLRSEYTALPRGIEQGVYQLVDQIIKGKDTPYARAVALQDHLISNYSYTLDVPYPPMGRDFVSHFLLEQKNGYCSYFATAMAVMGRIAGLPTRYIEGYSVKKPGPEGTVVTGRNAHAWVEIYFSGIGWLSFNPTPGDESGAGDQSGDSAPHEPDEEEQPPEDEEEQEEEEPEADESDEQEPAAEPTPPPPESPDDQPEDQPEDSASEDEPPQDDPPNRWMQILLILLLIAILVALALLLRERIKSSDPVALHQAATDDASRLAIWYRALLTLLHAQGQMPNPSETPAQFAARLSENGLCDPAFKQLADQFTINRYANVLPERGIYKAAQSAYKAQIQTLKPLERLNWWRKRIFSGIGNVEQIP